MLVINMYNTIRNKEINIKGNRIHKLSDIKNYSANMSTLVDIYKIILYSDNIQKDIDTYTEYADTERLKENEENLIRSQSRAKQKEKLEYFKKECIARGIELDSEDYKDVAYIRRTHPKWSAEKCIEFAMNTDIRYAYKNKMKKYKEFREANNLNSKELKRATDYIRNQKKKGIEISLTDALKHIQEHDKSIDIEWRDKWRKVVESGILEIANRNAVMYYMKAHPEYSIENIIEHFKNDKMEYKVHPNLTEYCDKLGLSYNKVFRYINKNNCSVEDGILHYNPYCYYSITGEFIIVPLSKNTSNQTK